MIFKLPYSRLNEIFKKLSETEDVYIPYDENENVSAFHQWEDGMEMSKAVNTVRSAKDFFFPQVEPLVNFKVEPGNIEIIDIRKECDDFIIFGARACDVRSFKILDEVFLAEPVDTFYQNRREHGTIVTLACSHPLESCFCNTFDIDAADPLEGDVKAWIIEDEIYFKAITNKGEKLLDKIKDILLEGDENTLKEHIEKIRAILKRTPLYDLKVPDLRGKTKELWGNSIWDELSRVCLGCGTCTFVCPTCQCFDVRDFKCKDGKVERYRCWDSCMYSEFTKMAAANPRLTQKEKFRQRFMHKLVYAPENHEGVASCVGCGRCVRKCPNSLNIVKVIKKLGEE